MSQLVFALGSNVNASGQGTIGEWLATALTCLLAEGEGFNPKRPCGFSGWESDLVNPIIEAGFARDESQALHVLKEAIWEALCVPKPAQPAPRKPQFFKGQVVVLDVGENRGQLRLVWDAGQKDVVRVHTTSAGWRDGRPEIFLADELKPYEAPSG